MDTWYRLSLGDGVLAPGAQVEIEAAYQKLFKETASPSDRAIFTRPESEGRLYCEIIAYFSPALYDLAESFDAEPCLKPERAGLRLLAGTEEAWTVLFAK